MDRRTRWTDFIKRAGKAFAASNVSARDMMLRLMRMCEEEGIHPRTHRSAIELYRRLNGCDHFGKAIGFIIAWEQKRLDTLAGQEAEMMAKQLNSNGEKARLSAALLLQPDVRGQNRPKDASMQICWPFYQRCTCQHGHKCRKHHTVEQADGAPHSAKGAEGEHIQTSVTHAQPDSHVEKQSANGTRFKKDDDAHGCPFQAQNMCKNTGVSCPLGSHKEAALAKTRTRMAEKAGKKLREHANKQANTPKIDNPTTPPPDTSFASTSDMMEQLNDSLGQGLHTFKDIEKMMGQKANAKFVTAARSTATHKASDPEFKTNKTFQMIKAILKIMLNSKTVYYIFPMTENDIVANTMLHQHKKENYLPTTPSQSQDAMQRNDRKVIILICNKDKSLILASCKQTGPSHIHKGRHQTPVMFFDCGTVLVSSLDPQLDIRACPGGTCTKVVNLHGQRIERALKHSTSVHAQARTGMNVSAAPLKILSTRPSQAYSEIAPTVLYNSKMNNTLSDTTPSSTALICSNGMTASNIHSAMAIEDIAYVAKKGLLNEPNARRLMSVISHHAGGIDTFQYLRKETSLPKLGDNADRPAQRRRFLETKFTTSNKAGKTLLATGYSLLGERLDGQPKDMREHYCDGLGANANGSGLMERRLSLLQEIFDTSSGKRVHVSEYAKTMKAINRPHIHPTKEPGPTQTQECANSHSTDLYESVGVQGDSNNESVDLYGDVPLDSTRPGKYFHTNTHGKSSADPVTWSKGYAEGGNTSSNPAQNRQPNQSTQARSGRKRNREDDTTLFFSSESDGIGRMLSLMTKFSKGRTIKTSTGHHVDSYSKYWQYDKWKHDVEVSAKLLALSDPIQIFKCGTTKHKLPPKKQKEWDNNRIRNMRKGLKLVFTPESDEGKAPLSTENKQLSLSIGSSFWTRNKDKANNDGQDYHGLLLMEYRSRMIDDASKKAKN